MEKTYKVEITGEIRRILRNLEEACAEQQITMEEALEWYVANKAKTEIVFKESVSTKQELSYRERVELFVSKCKWVEDEEQKAICIVVLCYLNQHEKCPAPELIVHEISYKLGIHQSYKDGMKKMCFALTMLLQPRLIIECSCSDSWENLRGLIFPIAKSL